ncbi:type II secretion system F family protein [Nocardiopsis sp. CT-R113]|uniref:Type II secretion system F family protein n=1 Tax=Nocardiopsis codii TaxID=3065942 RepID=A0ABU7K9L5_9ACTN|nr:type II secretion system F family protein [Nocardiopsis sp. CT-R113]MEE2038931.1 type II secretion system F family protein [Nocardiopsis sp. CT-R113]
MNAAMLGLAGTMVGAGVWAAAYGLRRPALAERLTPRPEPQPRSAPGGGWARRAGQRASGLLANAGIPGPVMTRTLAVAGTPVEDYRAEKAAASGLGLLLTLVLVIAVGVVLPGAASAVLLAVSGAVVGTCFFAPDLAARSAATEQRADLRATTSALADLVVMGLAAGAGSTGALTTALQHGQGRAPERIRNAVNAATLRHQPPWEGLEALARETEVRELAELAASLRLGGTSGARTRSSLTAKAASLRARRLAEAEAAAHAATERMTLPTMGLVSGFLLLICFVALTHVMAGF